MSQDKKELIVNETDLSYSETNQLNVKQLQLLLKKTPEKYLKTRPAKGGGKWTYVTGGYVRKVLNMMFGWDWDFEVLEQFEAYGEVVVKGRLTCRTAKATIVKTQFGNKEVVNKKDGTVLSIGNDYKAAATDALKKCAAEIGIASDVYNAEEFRSVFVQPKDADYSLDRLKELFNEHYLFLTDQEKSDISRIINNQETESYRKAIKIIDKCQG